MRCLIGTPVNTCIKNNFSRSVTPEFDGITLRTIFTRSTKNFILTNFITYRYKFLGLIRKTKILILDEATASVDAETDQLVQSTIRSEFSDCTILAVAHRIDTIDDSDRIIVMDKGHVAEFDSPTHLKEDEHGIYYGMYKSSGHATS